MKSSIYKIKEAAKDDISNFLHSLKICNKVNYFMTCSKFKNFVANNTIFLALLNLLINILSSKLFSCIKISDFKHKGYPYRFFLSRNAPD